MNEAAYAPVNGLEMYYEIHGAGEPLIVLPGAYMTVGLMGVLVPALAERHRVIAVEFQGHGHTADIDRPSSYEQFAADAAALLDHVGVDRADVYGYSLGGGVALQLGLRHPGRVRKLVVASASYSSQGMYPEVLEGIENVTPEMFDGTPWRDADDRTAPDPSAFPTLVEKLKQLDMSPFDWPIDELAQPALIIIGDSDGTRLEHAVEMFHPLGGGVFGDLAPELPASQLAISPARPTLACSSAPNGSRRWSRPTSRYRTDRACACHGLTRPGRRRRGDPETTDRIGQALALPAPARRGLAMRRGHQLACDGLLV